MKELISVIVCAYNQEGTIARTLDSILRQQCHLPVEIILGEDCSTDHTLDVCRQYAERYPESIRLMANAQNKGIIDNYFDCLLAAQGQYIADCAGDDEWSDPEKLEKELRIMEAQQLLLDYPELPVATVGQMVGIDDKTNFKRQFEQIVGMSPRAWREKHLRRA